MLKSPMLLAGGAVLLLSLSSAPAQTAAKTSIAPPQPEAPSTFEKFFDDSKNPTPWITWDADLRVRNEYINEAVTLSESDKLYEQDVFRFRGRFWTTATVVTNLTINGRVSAEPRLWMHPSFVGAYKGQSGMEWRYGIADLLNIKWDHILDQPLTITVGRQDIQLGDAGDFWLVGDGTPSDGSWSLFLDSVRLTWQPQDLKTKFDVIYINQNARPDEWIPTIGNSENYYLTEQNERGVVLYASNKSIENMQVDGYLIYKHDNRETFTILGTKKTPGDNADIYTAGGKITGTPAEHWSYSAEGAYQFGTKEDKILGVDDTRDISAYGGKFKLSYLVKDAMNNTFSIVGEYLSGDDPKTGKDEMFDILWGRWPRWSELYAYSYINETGGRIGQWNNVGRVGPQWTITPLKNLTFSATYNALFAPESIPTRATSAGLFTGDGHFRGHYGQAVLKYQFNKHLSGHLWAEGIWQGDYYKNRDLISFLRAEVMMTF